MLPYMTRGTLQTGETKDLNTGVVSWMIEVGPVPSRGPLRENEGGRSQRKGLVIAGAEFGPKGFEEEGRAQRPRRAGVG